METRTEQIPHGSTAQRLAWQVLPPHVRALIEDRCGSAVLHAESQGGGFTPGFASVLQCADGSRHFVKAAAAQAQPMFAESYRQEARVLGALPEVVPAPPLRWWHDEDWVVLETAYVAGRAPARPWRAPDLDACLDLVEQVAEQLTPPPAMLGLPGFAEECHDDPALWDRIRASPPDLPGLARHLDEAAGLAAGFAAVTGGETVVHNDLRDDNLLLDAAGRAWACDWNWPAVGAAWLDTVSLLIGPRADGLDVDAVLATRPLTRDVPAEHVDTLLALLCGYFLAHADLPVPPTSPFLRAAQRVQGETVWHWLAQRRGW